MLSIQNLIGKPKIVVSEIDSSTTKFEVDYLPRGFGHTVGNALRRFVLGYDIGGAVTGLKIKGVAHEFSTIDGVKEAAIDIMLNFKKLRFTVAEETESLQWIFQNFSGTGKYTASDLVLPAGVELLSDDQYLFEITDSSVELSIDFRVEKGYGYMSIDLLKRREEKNDSQDIGLLLIDNDFKIVEYVKYDVEEVIDDFMGGSKDKLVLELKTVSEKISPKQVLSFAGEVVSSYFKLFVFDSAYVDKSAIVEFNELEDTIESAVVEMDIKTIPIDALPLSERTRNALIKNEILYVEDLEKRKKSELLSMKGVGRKAVDEIAQSLENMGKSLAG